MLASVLVGLVVAVAPALALYYRAGIGPSSYDGLELVFLYLPLVIASFVFVTLERTRPEWWHGVAFGFGVAVPATAVLLTLYGLKDTEFRGQLGGLLLAGLMFIVFGSALGMAGSGLGVLVSRPLVSDSRHGWYRGIRPSHLGAAVALVELSLVGALIASST
jgi:hypothetical protein